MTTDVSLPVHLNPSRGCHHGDSQGTVPTGWQHGPPVGDQIPGQDKLLSKKRSTEDSKGGFIFFLYVLIIFLITSCPLRQC